MLETWNSTIYESIKQKLLDSAIKLIQDERCGQVIDSQLVVGVRESCGGYYLTQLPCNIVLLIKNYYSDIV